MPTTRKVLLVDDDVTTIRLIADALASEFDVMFATDAQEGLEKAESLEPDVILLDVVMPGTDGFTLCRKLKSNPKTQPIPVIFVSALNAIGQQLEGFDIGAVDYITKPIEVPILRARVRTQSRLYKQTLELASLAATDPLTGVPNRRKFDETFASEWARSTRQQEPLSMLMIDIDEFKRYNDSYGHGRGDECLVRVATVLRECIHRSTDLVARLGGEEFGVILPDTDLAGTQEIAQSIINAFAEQRIPRGDGAQFSYLTVSVGYCTRNASDETMQHLFERADAALYRAKSGGRNQAVGCRDGEQSD